MPSPESDGGTGEAPGHGAFSRHARERLVDIAAASIEHGLAHGAPLAVDPADHPDELRELGASFVTLRRAGALRGCMGGLVAEHPLVESVARAAFAAAFRDPRFPPLGPEECDDLESHVTVLGPATPIEAPDERSLLAQLRPGVDGLVLRRGDAGATFLPAVWKSLPDPARFVAALRRKAGLPPGQWSADHEYLRYEALELG